MFYNYKCRDVVDDELGVESISRKQKNCMSSPPMDTLESRSLLIYMRNNEGVLLTDLDEDTDYGTAIKILYPAGCAAGASVFGSTIFTDTSTVCAAAIHRGVIDDATGGLVEIMLNRGIHYDDVDISTRSNELALLVKTWSMPELVADYFTSQFIPSRP